MLLEKKQLSAAQIEAQTAIELPDREMLAPQRGLVNVNIGDVTIQLPIGVAANVCDVNAAVLAAAIVDTGSAECNAAVDQNL